MGFGDSDILENVAKQDTFQEYMECFSISALIQLSLIIKQLEAFEIFEITQTKQQFFLLYSFRFSRYSSPIHWLIHSHMTSNNETVSRQLP